MRKKHLIKSNDKKMNVASHFLIKKTSLLQSMLHHAVDDSHLGANCFLGKKNLDVNPNWNQHVRKEEEEEDEEKFELLNKGG